MFQSALLNAVARLATAAFNFAVVILLSQALAPADRGQAGFYVALLTAAQLLADFAAGSTIPYLRQQYPLGFLLRVYRWWSLPACTAVIAGVGALKGVPMVHQAGLWLAALANCQATVHQHSLLAHQRLVWFNRLMVMPAAGMAVLLGAGKLAGLLSIEFFIISLIVNWLFTSLVGWWQVQKLPDAGDTGRLGHSLWPVFKAGMVNQSTQLLGLFNTRLAYFLLPAAALGSFANALALAEALLIIPGALGQVMYARLVQAQGAPPAGTLRKALLTSLVLTGGAGLLLLGLPDSFFRWLLGADNGRVSPMLLLLAPAMLFYSVYIIISYWQSAFGRFWFNLVAIAGGLLFSSVFYGWSGQRGWPVSTVVGVLATSLVLNALLAVLLYLVRRQMWRRCSRLGYTHR